jgi:hypothetical protein
MLLTYIILYVNDKNNKSDTENICYL